MLRQPGVGARNTTMTGRGGGVSIQPVLAPRGPIGRRPGGGKGAKRMIEKESEAVRTAATSSVQKLHVHDLSFTSHDLVLSEEAYPNLRWVANRLILRR